MTTSYGSSIFEGSATIIAVSLTVQGSPPKSWWKILQKISNA